MSGLANQLFGRDLRVLMNQSKACKYEAIPPGCRCIIVGESPPPLNRKVTCIDRWARLSGDDDFLLREYVYRTNVNALCPGVRGRGSKAPNRDEATFAAQAILNLNLSGKRVAVRHDTAFIFLILGRSAAKAFRMFEEHSPHTYRDYQLYRIDDTVNESDRVPWFVQRFIVRLPHPSSVNHRGYDRERVAQLLRTIRSRAVLPPIECFNDAATIALCDAMLTR